MKDITEITSEDWADLLIFIEKKLFDGLTYPYPLGLVSYRDEVMTSLRFIKDGINLEIKRSRISKSPLLTIEHLPFFVVKWLADHGYYEM